MAAQRILSPTFMMPLRVSHCTDSGILIHRPFERVVPVSSLQRGAGRFVATTGMRRFVLPYANNFYSVCVSALQLDGILVP